MFISRLALPKLGTQQTTLKHRKGRKKRKKKPSPKVMPSRRQAREKQCAGNKRPQDESKEKVQAKKRRQVKQTWEAYKEAYNGVQVCWRCQVPGCADNNSKWSYTFETDPFKH